MNGALDTFLSTCASFGDIQIVSRGSKLPAHIAINSLVFESCKGPFVVILPEKEKVDRAKLKFILDVPSVDLVPFDHVESICGFAPGTVPPLGHFTTDPLPTYVDQGLIDQVRKASEDPLLLGGGGHPYWQCLVSLDTLTSLDHVQIATVAVDKNTHMEDAQEERQGSSFSALDLLQTTAPRPLFGVTPPPSHIARLVIQQRDLPNPLQPVWVTTVGRVGKVQQKAKRLVFCDLLPPTSGVAANPKFQKKGLEPGVSGSEEEDDELPWVSGLDGQGMKVQLIAGKSLCQRLGNDRGETAIQALKEGQLIMVQAKTNVGNRESLGDWVDKRTLDLVVFHYQVLEDGEADGAIPAETGFGAAPVKHQLPSHDVSTVQSSLPTFTLQDCFPKINGGGTPVLVVDGMDSLRIFIEDYSRLLSSLDDENGDETKNNITSTAMIGVDCEWRPSVFTAPGMAQPVLVLQLSFHPLQKVFLLDFQTLLRPLLPPDEPMNEVETVVSDILGEVFTSKRLMKVGYQLTTDLQRMAASYPHVPCFQEIDSMLEVSMLVKRVLQMTKQKRSRMITMSLARLCQHYFGKTLDKENQVSDWSVRPLSEQQIEYASLDAAIAPLLAEKALVTVQACINGDRPRIERWDGDESLSKGIYSWRFLFLQTEDEKAIRKLNAKQFVGDSWVVTQSWITGQDPPRPPSVPSPSGDAPYTDITGVLRLPSRMIQIQQNGIDELCTKIVGQELGKTKDRCFSLFLTGDAALPSGARIDYPQRSGYVEFDDGVALFVNMPDKPVKNQPRSYPNEWLDGGRCLSWFLRSGEWRDGKTELAQKLLSSDPERPGKDRGALALLFIRIGKGNFISCGRCSVQTPETADEGQSEFKNWGLVQLNLKLLDYEALTLCSDFMNLVNMGSNKIKDFVDEDADEDEGSF
jgi:prolyl-tRNA editing enzyme YbaK/EbsC (Cys-tRNA(Pro) deacylase)